MKVIAEMREAEESRSGCEPGGWSQRQRLYGHESVSER